MPTLATPETAPADCRLNAAGHYVPESKVAEIDKLRDDLVITLIKKAKAQQQLLAEFKKLAFTELDNFVDLSAAEYYVTIGGKKGNISLYSYDGTYKIQVQVADRLMFDERLQVAKELIDDCIHRWSESSNDNIKALVNHAFETDKEGKLSVGRILGLRQLKITDDEWAEAMRAIADSIQVINSARYIRFYEQVGTTNQYKAISLDIAKL